MDNTRKRLNKNSQEYLDRLVNKIKNNGIIYNAYDRQLLKQKEPFIYELGKNNENRRERLRIKNDPTYRERKRLHAQEERDRARDNDLEAYHERCASQQQSRLVQLRENILEYYDDFCGCCEIVEHDFLGIDHIDGGGVKHRKEVGSGVQFYRWLIKNNYPSNIVQILCWNCNLGKSFNCNVCPHHAIVFDPIKSQNQIYRMQLRQEIIETYGAICICCGEDEYLFLSIDHKDGGGNQHKKEVGFDIAFYNWIINNNFPDILQILCYNCNIGRYRNEGICPHTIPGRQIWPTTSESMFWNPMFEILS